MGRSFNRPCANRQCANLVTGKRRLCTKCESTSARAAYVDQGTGFSLYRSKQWQRLRRMVLAASPLCVECNAVASVVDHIVPIKHGGERWAMSNLQPMCDACHNKKRARESRAAAPSINADGK